MRPNIDIPWSIHGRIKEHVEQTDQTIEDGYIEVLKEGLDQLPDTQEDAKLPENSYVDFEPRLVETQGSESHHINQSLTFQPYFSLREESKQFGTPSLNMTTEQFERAIANLYEIGYLTDDWFTVHQLGGALIGRGARNFVSAVTQANDRFSDAKVDMYKNGHILYLARLRRESEYMLLRGELSRHSRAGQVLTNVQLRFITHGTPISGQEYYSLARCFGITELFNATELSLPRIGIRFNKPRTIEVVDKIIRPENSGEERWISGLLVENPLQNDPKLLEDLKRGLSDDNPEASEANSNIDTLRNYDVVYCELDHHHHLSDDYEYTFDGLSATYTKPLFGRNSTWNLALDVNW